MSKKYGIKPKDFVELIERYDPFGFKEKDGTVCVFQNYGEVYFRAMMNLAELFPRGYIDIPLYLSECTGMDIVSCKAITRDWSRQYGVDEVLLLEWWRDSPERNFFMKKLLLALHSLSGTTLDEAFFRNALSLFQLKCETMLERRRHEEENETAAK